MFFLCDNLLILFNINLALPLNSLDFFLLSIQLLIPLDKLQLIALALAIVIVLAPAWLRILLLSLGNRGRFCRGFLRYQL